MKVPKSPVHYIYNATIFCLFFLISYNSISQQLAFPTAKGAGAYASGGRGGQVIHVTTLNWAATGGLKQAIQTPGPRTIVFDVSGEIDATAMGNYETLVRGSAYDNMTIAGQSAPLGGITIKTTYFLFEEVDNIIIRYIRFRNVDTYNNSDASWFQGANNLILDHCTFSHGNDECLDVSDSAASIPPSNVTIQNCFLQNSKTGSLLGSQNATGKFTFANNAISNISHRFPNIGGTSSSQADIVNNVIYNWKARLIRLTYSGKYNIINNYYKTSVEGLRRQGWYPGSTVIPATGLHRLQAQDSDNPLIYTTGSIVTGQRNTPQINDSDMWSYFDGSGPGFTVGGSVAGRFFTATQFPLAGKPFTIKTANQAYIDVLADVGANHYLNADGSYEFYQDTKDAGDILMIKNDTFVSYESNNFTYSPINLVPYPTVPSNTRPADFYASNLHIPQVWFQAHVPAGQDHNDIAPSGYTWLEEYLNGVDVAPIVTIGVQSIAVNPSSAELQIAETIQLTATFLPSNATNQNGTWHSNNAAIATINTNGLVTAVSAGEATITFTTADGSFTDTSAITVLPEALDANAGNDQQICENESTTLTATGGITYLWSTGATTATITVTPNSTTTYTVTVFDATGNNSDTDDVIVTVNPIPNVDAGLDVTINVGNFVTLTASGANSYIWNTGQTTSSIEVNPLSISTYTVTGTNSNGCEATDSVTVFLIDTNVTANAGSDVTICEGEDTTLSATGGNSYLWNTGATTPSITVNPASTTVYTVTVFGLLGLNSDTDDVTVTVNPLPTINAGNDITINSGESTTLSAVGGNSYAWNTGETTQDIIVSPNSTTIYTVTGTSNGCEATDTVTVFLVGSNVIADAGSDVAICEGTITTLTATGGSTYLWSSGATTASINVSPNSSTTYTVTAFDANGNSDTDEVTVTVNPLPTINAGNDITINSGESTTLSAIGGNSYLWNTGETTQDIIVSPNSTTIYTVTGTSSGCEATDTVTVFLVDSNVIADAGSDVAICEGNSIILTATGGSNYLWSTGATTASINVSPNSSATYIVTAFDDNGNSGTDDVNVTVNPLPTINAGNDITITLGESTILSATEGTSYVWSNGATTQNITVSPTVTTTYTVTGSVNNCEGTDSVTVTVAAVETVIANAGSDVAICDGTSTTLTATGGSNYLWSTGATTASINVSPNASTTYTVTAFDANGNSDTDEVTVTVNPLPTINAGNDVTITVGASTTLSATGANSYVWSNGATTQNITVSPNVTTTYTVTGSVNNCEGTDSVTVTVSAVETVIANAGSDVAICDGTSTTLTATGGTSYLWSTGATTASIDVSPNASTTYTVTAFDANGNSGTDDVTVTVNPLPTINAGNDVTITIGQNIILSATGGTSYVWSNGAITQNITVSPTATTTYTVNGILNGCEATDSVTVMVAAVETVIANAGADVSICEGSGTILTATGGTSYLWSTGATTASIDVNPNISTTYTVTAFNANGNSGTDEVAVTVNPLPTINAGNDITITLGESTILSATGGTSYVWSNGATTQNITVSPTATTTYTVNGSLNGCQTEDSVTVFVNLDTVTANAGEDQTTCQGYSVTLTASGGDNFLWSTGATTQSIIVNPNNTTTYSVTVYNGTNQDVDDVTVYVNPNPVVNVLNGSDVTILEGEYITLSASGANSYRWNNGATQPNIAVNPNNTTTYSVTGYINSCSDAKNVVVNVVPKVVAFAGEDKNICLNESVILTASGGDEFLWSTGETTPSIHVVPSIDTEYSVTVYNELDYDTADVMVYVNDCSTTPDTEITQNFEFLVYPNPTSGNLNIRISGLINVSNIYISDIAGKLLYQELVPTLEQNSYEKTLDLSKFPDGFYLLKLVDQRRTITKKIIVNK